MAYVVSGNRRCDDRSVSSTRLQGVLKIGNISDVQFHFYVQKGKPVRFPLPFLGYRKNFFEKRPKYKWEKGFEPFCFF